MDTKPFENISGIMLKDLMNVAGMTAKVPCNSTDIVASDLEIRDNTDSGECMDSRINIDEITNTRKRILSEQDSGHSLVSTSFRRNLPRKIQALLLRTRKKSQFSNKKVSTSNTLYPAIPSASNLNISEIRLAR